MAAAFIVGTAWAPGRRSFKGTRFKIGLTTLFNVEAPSGEVVGQAVTIREWEYENGVKVHRLLCLLPCNTVHLQWHALGPRASPTSGTTTAVLQGGENAGATGASAAPAQPPTAEQLAAAEAAVAEQGALVRCGGAKHRLLGTAGCVLGCASPTLFCGSHSCRSLKEEQGLTNTSQEVQDAVAQLLALKQQLQALQDAAAAAAAETTAG